MFKELVKALATGLTSGAGDELGRAIVQRLLERFKREDDDK